MQEVNAIECRGITKRFGPVLANDRIHLSVGYGEILALLGENGSGKTTLMNILSGIYRPDGGEVLIDGRRAAVHSPADAFRHGIGMIHQHFKLVEVMTALENILLGAPRERGVKAGALRGKVEGICGRYQLSVDLDKKIYDLSVSEKQTVEVLKALYRGARILILDEPTAVLTPQETERLFAILRKMRRDGCAIIIITHKLGEVMEISDRVSVLRKGRGVGDLVTADTDEKTLTELMVGRPIKLEITRPETAREGRREILRVENLTVRGPDGSKALEGVGFTLYGGEILGVAGVAGSGQKELCEALAGLLPCASGSIRFGDTELAGRDTAERNRLGIRLAFVPEDRLGMGLVGSMGMVGNLMLKTSQEARGPFVDRAPAREAAARLVDRLEIKTPSLETPVRTLSGGNVQKVLLGREIASDPEVLIAAYPVRGLDIGTSYTVYDLLCEQKRKGRAVLFVGEDLDVMLALCDRVLVLCHGEVTGVVDAREAGKERVGLLMAGVREAAS